MDNLIDQILTDWAYRVPNGMPDPKNHYHLIHLKESLNELKIPRKVAIKVLEKVRKYVDNPQNRKLNRVGEPWGSEGESSKDDKKGELDTTGEDKKEIDLDNFKKYLSNEQKKAIELSDKARVKKLEQLDSLAESFKNLPDEIKNTASNVFAKGQIYEGRPNSGIGKNRLGYLDVKNLSENKEYLLEA